MFSRTNRSEAPSPEPAVNNKTRAPPPSPQTDAEKAEALIAAKERAMEQTRGLRQQNQIAGLLGKLNIDQSGK